MRADKRQSNCRAGLRPFPETVHCRYDKPASHRGGGLGGVLAPGTGWFARHMFALCARDALGNVAASLTNGVRTDYVWADDGGSGNGGANANPGADRLWPPAYSLSFQARWAFGFALALGRRGRPPSVEPGHLAIGLYGADCESLERFWVDGSPMADFIVGLPGGSEWPRWKIWALRLPHRNVLVRRSARLATIFDTSRQWAKSNETYPPVITTQALLLALATDAAAAMGPALEASGLNVPRLRLAVTGVP